MESHTKAGDVEALGEGLRETDAEWRADAVGKGELEGANEELGLPEHESVTGVAVGEALSLGELVADGGLVDRGGEVDSERGKGLGLPETEGEFEARKGLGLPETEGEFEARKGLGLPEKEGEFEARKGLGLPEKEGEFEAGKGLGLPEKEGEGDVLGVEEPMVSSEVLSGGVFHDTPRASKTPQQKQRQSVLRHSKSLRLASRDPFLLVTFETTKRRDELLGIACPPAESRVTPNSPTHNQRGRGLHRRTQALCFFFFLLLLLVKQEFHTGTCLDQYS